MAESTPVKVYGKQIPCRKSMCRLCCGIYNAKHTKNLYHEANVHLLRLAERIYGGKLENGENLPHLLCRPCERRLANLEKFRDLVCKNQNTMMQKKRCSVDMSPSLPTAVGKKARDEAASMATSSNQIRLTLFASNEQSKVVDETSAAGPDPTSSVRSSFADTLKKINEELRNVAVRDTPSVLRRRCFTGLRSFSIEAIVNELKTRCPVSFMVLSEMMEFSHNEEKKIAALGLIYATIMFKRCHELSLLQRVNTILLADSDANTEIYERFNKYGICLGKTSKYSIQDEIGSHFMDKVVEEIKNGKTFSFVLDNIDWDVKVHEMRSDNANKSVHAVATSVVFDRISSSHLPDDEPQQSLATCDVTAVVDLSEHDLKVQRQQYKLIAGQILSQCIPAFDFLKELVKNIYVPVQVQYEAEMQEKSLVVPFPVLFKDEKRYADVVDVLDQLEEWLHKIYTQAGTIPYKEDDTQPDIPAQLPAASHPGQPLSHVHPAADSDDPLSKLKVPCFGDQLTRVRLAGAKDLRAGFHTARDRTDHIYPVKCADWHCKRSFLKLVFKKLYKNSGRAKGTLRFFREKLQRRNVSIDVKHYEECEQLFITVGRAYTVAALMDFFGMTSIDELPSCHPPPYDVLHGSGDKQLYFDEVLDKFVDQYIMPPSNADSLDIPPTDRVTEYSLCLLKLFFILSDFKQAVKTGNGDRLASLHKVLLKHFKSDKGFNSYAIEMLISILQDKIFLTKAQAHQTRWAATANFKGGPNNMEIDLLQENINRELKKGIKRMGANKTQKAIERLSMAAGGTMEIVNNFDSVVGIKAKSTAHGHKASMKDEKIVIADLLSIKPFEHIRDREHEGFPNASSDPLSTLDYGVFHKWLNRHKKNLLKHGPLDLSSDNEDD